MVNNTTLNPTEQDAILILKSELLKDVQHITRFSTGLANYVYDVETTDGQTFVVRITPRHNKRGFESALGWYTLLTEKGVPLPKLYYSTLDEMRYGFPVMIMERLAGKI